jgi:hypothetical protein
VFARSLASQKPKRYLDAMAAAVRGIEKEKAASRGQESKSG